MKCEAGYTILDTRYEIRDTRYEIRDTRYEIRDTRYEIRKVESQKKFSPKFSFEFFPPRTPEAVGKLQMTQERLARFKPDFFSVTYGAGGSTRQRTFETVQDIREKTGIDAAPHISCIGSMTSEIKSVLETYKAAGIKRTVALRGDHPSGIAGGYGQLRYASELVEFIRQDPRLGVPRRIRSGSAGPVRSGCTARARHRRRPPGAAPARSCGRWSASNPVHRRGHRAR